MSTLQRSLKRISLHLSVVCLFILAVPAGCPVAKPGVTDRMTTVTYMPDASSKELIATGGTGALVQLPKGSLIRFWNESGSSSSHTKVKTNLDKILPGGDRVEPGPLLVKENGDEKIGEIPESSILKTQITSGNPNALENQNGKTRNGPSKIPVQSVSKPPSRPAPGVPRVPPPTRAPPELPASHVLQVTRQRSSEADMKTEIKPDIPHQKPSSVSNANTVVNELQNGTVNHKLETQGVMKNQSSNLKMAKEHTAALVDRTYSKTKSSKQPSDSQVSQDQSGSLMDKTGE
ncbi:hypothetical protein PGT21_001483 [Puccinia graminis f. sp. tritici]|uniref:Uncharacterized protein n=1 Tax=Puccinia graminis f. sp. tritici TaxID=56615 RepID=A0A5B0MSI9_PUCGR|nr:hypothetical protein PGT21_001483 [Puccinia graminis f. sp. tritici]KAA1079935.1 hypothetical protein PGTUg99_007264 [Puccinia graminis f. sp. tritici]